MGTVTVTPLRRWLAAESEPAAAADRSESFMRHLGRELGFEVRWPEEGEPVLERPWDPFDLHAVRSLAADGEYPARTLFMRRAFRLREDPRDHPGLRRIFDGAPTAFPHLMRHSDNRGIWIPARFEHPVPSDDDRWWMVGSVPGVLAELERVEPRVDEGGERLRASFVALWTIFSAANEATLPVIVS